MEWGQQQQETQLEGHISKEGWGVDSSLLVLVNEDISVMLQNRFYGLCALSKQHTFYAIYSLLTLF